MEKEISIIIPALNEAKTLGRTLEHLKRWQISSDIIVVDGGSVDATKSIARAFPCVRVVKSPKKGRATQMNEGVKHAKHDLLFFLHADTLPPKNARALIQKAFYNKPIIAAAFSLTFNSEKPIYKFLDYLSTLNFIWATYGDQGLILTQETFQKFKGFKEIPFLEDIDLQYRLRLNGRFYKFPERVVTSARRFEKNGVFKQVFINYFIILFWWIGVSPKVLKNWYS